MEYVYSKNYFEKPWNCLGVFEMIILSRIKFIATIMLGNPQIQRVSRVGECELKIAGRAHHQLVMCSWLMKCQSINKRSRDF